MGGAVTAPAWVPAQHDRFLKERARRAELARNIGRPGHCRRCGKPDLRSLFLCRRLRAIHCAACRKLNTAEFYESVEREAGRRA